MNTPWHNQSVGQNCKGMRPWVEIGVLGTSEKRSRERSEYLQRDELALVLERGVLGTSEERPKERSERWYGERGEYRQRNE